MGDGKGAGMVQKRMHAQTMQAGARAVQTLPIRARAR